MCTEKTDKTYTEKQTKRLTEHHFMERYAEAPWLCVYLFFLGFFVGYVGMIL